MRVRDWPWRRKVALGAWVPVGVVAFVLFTGPNGASSATPPTTEPRTVGTVKVAPPKVSLKNLKEKFASIKATQDDVAAWIQATPNRLTVAQQLAKAKWRATRRKQLLVDHKAAVASSHHRNG